MNLDALSAPFPDAAISWRVGSSNIDKKTGEPRGDKGPSGMALAYIDARDVMNRLDEVCGPNNWKDSYTETPKGRVFCTLALRIDGEWVEKSDGAGDSDVESEKGAISDALKRAAVKWGIGRYLYDLESPWVDLEKRGSTWIIAKVGRDKLNKVHASFVRQLGGAPAPKQPAANDAPPPQPNPAPPQVTDEAQRRADAIIANINAANTPEDVEAAMKKAVRTLNQLHDSRPKLYEAVQAARALRMGKLKADQAFNMQAAE